MVPCSGARTRLPLMYIIHTLTLLLGLAAEGRATIAAGSAAAAPVTTQPTTSGPGRLVAVLAVTRHGARNVLPKSSHLVESEATGGPTLLPAGQQQCHAAGVAFRARYIDQTTCRRTATCLAVDLASTRYGVTGTRGVGFSNYNTLASSSALDRTISSAQAFLAGVFPPLAADAPAGEQPVPVYSLPDSEDVLVRGYTKCPAYAARLDNWLRSAEFGERERDSERLRARVQAVLPGLNTSLANWWNVYDAFNVWRSYGVGEPMPPLDDATYNQTVELAMWLESAKMRPSLAGNLLGGALLSELLSRFNAAENAVRESSGSGRDIKPYYRLVTLTGHYNTQLGMLSALAGPGGVPPGHAWASVIPPLGSVLAFELHVDDEARAAAAASNAPAAEVWGGFAVRAVQQSGPGAPYVTIDLPCASTLWPDNQAERLAGPGACTLEAFRSLAGEAALNGSDAWCDACRNTRVLACAVGAMSRQLAEAGLLLLPDQSAGSGMSAHWISSSSSSSSTARAAGGAGSTSSGRRMSSPGMVALWCVLSVALAAAAAGGALLAARAVQRRRAAAQLVRTAKQGGTGMGYI